MKFIKLVGLVLVVLSLNSICFAIDDGDFQYWSAWGTSVKLNDDWKVTVEEELRYSSDRGNIYYTHTDIGAVYSGLYDWLDLGVNYRLVHEESSSTEWRNENRPHFNITFKHTYKDIKLSNRSRLEFRDKEVSKDLWRYRNKSTAKFAEVQIAKLKLKPYLADEIFVDFGSAGFTRNRIYSGVSFDITEKVKGQVYYMWQTSKSGSIWKDANILGTSVKFPF